MRYSNILKIIGILLFFYSFTLLPPILVSYIYAEVEYTTFLISFFIFISSGLFLWSINRNSDVDLRKRDGFLIVVLAWVVLAIYSTIPFILSADTNIGFIDALFESTSGLTTTGATVIEHLDDLPRSILFYRNQLSFIGGMGILVLAVAILPILGIGGMQLFKAEVTGVTKDSKLTPRITETAKLLWGIYVALLLSCTLFYFIAGMSLFDAICFAFGTVSTGGYAPHDASLGYYNSRLIEFISVIFMLLSAINFALHFMAFRNKSIKYYFKDLECRSYLTFLFVSWIIVSLGLIFFNITLNLSENSIIDNILDSLFHIVSLSSTTGFTSSGFSFWPSFVPFLVFYIGVIGGCAGSTSGGLKIIRMILLYKQSSHEIKQLIHPQGKFYIKYGDTIINNKISNAVWGFMAIYLAMFIFFMLLLISDNNSFISSFSAVASCLSNIGPALGEFVSHYQNTSDFSKVILSMAMIIGRLEIFTVLVLFSSYFWNDT